MNAHYPLAAAKIHGGDVQRNECEWYNVPESWINGDPIEPQAPTETTPKLDSCREPEWASAVVQTMAWIYNNHASKNNYRKHQSLIGHSFSDWANTELLARSQRRVRGFHVMQNGTWKHIDSLNKEVMRRWARHLDLREKYDYFEQNYTSEGAIGDAYETACP